jgi:hypothetical protein
LRGSLYDQVTLEQRAEEVTQQTMQLSRAELFRQIEQSMLRHLCVQNPSPPSL